MNTVENDITGGCACGRVTYRIDGKPADYNYCYCITCQKTSGAPMLSFTDFDSSSVTWNHPPDIWTSSDIAERYFCKVCGSPLGMKYFFDPGCIGITTGSMDGNKDRKPAPGAHIFLKDKPDWVKLPDDGGRRQEEFGAKMAERINNWRKERASDAQKEQEKKG